MKQWLVISSSAQAYIYDISTHAMEKSEPFLIKELTHPESRLKSQDLKTDGSGRYKSSGATVGDFAAPTDPHQEEQAKFAHILADELQNACVNHEFEQIIICAEPHFKGLLENELSKEVKAVVKKFINKNYVPLANAELQKIIADIKHGDL